MTQEHRRYQDQHKAVDGMLGELKEWLYEALASVSEKILLGEEYHFHICGGTIDKNTIPRALHIIVLKDGEFCPHCEGKSIPEEYEPLSITNFLHHPKLLVVGYPGIDFEGFCRDASDRDVLYLDDHARDPDPQHLYSAIQWAKCRKRYILAGTQGLRVLLYATQRKLWAPDLVLFLKGGGTVVEAVESGWAHIWKLAQLQGQDLLIQLVAGPTLK